MVNVWEKHFVLLLVLYLQAKFNYMDFISKWNYRFKDLKKFKLLFNQTRSLENMNKYLVTKIFRISNWTSFAEIKQENRRYCRETFVWNHNGKFTTKGHRRGS